LILLKAVMTSQGTSDDGEEKGKSINQHDGIIPG